MQATRQQILDYLHRHGARTVRDITGLLSLTATGVRQHLTVLERDGLVEAHEERGHVGRPAHVYRLSPRGEALYPRNYDTLANLLMEEVRAMAGADALQRLMRRVSSRLAERYSERTEGLSLAERVAVTADVLREQGCVVETAQHGDEFQLRQCTCPYPNVARRHSAVCALEVGFVQRMTGADARLTSSLLRGDSACTYRIRARDGDDAASRRPGS
ncbi:MAG TPA: helix-turn-helix domain-containing protein [Dehalococcoidia bacterium]|nr:helix-turn-helix domain-containing protein [Dehalococcoidia bacterium]